MPKQTLTSEQQRALAHAGASMAISGFHVSSEALLVIGQNYFSGDRSEIVRALVEKARAEGRTSLEVAREYFQSRPPVRDPWKE